MSMINESVIIANLIFISVSLLFMFILIPYVLAYFAFIFIYVSSGNTNITYMFTKGLKAPFSKGGTLRVFIFIEIIFVVLSIIATIKVLLF